MPAELTLNTGGAAYAGWKSVSVRRSMEHCAGAFELKVSDLWPGNDVRRRIQPGERCEVLIDRERVITGHVDVLQMQIDGDTREVSVTGRDLTADLVDCSAVRAPGQWRGQKVERIAQDLAAPFGVPVHVEVDTGRPLASFALQEGETVHEAIERAARMRALLLMAGGDGALLITRAGLRRAPTPLVLGQNMLAARARLDMRDRFSQYTLKGQAPGSDFFSGRAAAQIVARAVDPNVRRHRPMVVTDQSPDAAGSLRDRALWEANVRAARSTQVEIQVQGWRHAGGLWQPNTVVRTVAPELQLDQDLLLHAVEYQLDERGQACLLSLTRPDAYTVLPLRDAPAEPRRLEWAMPRQAGQ
jgi:prophage tail gpP-like protein